MQAAAPVEGAAAPCGSHVPAVPAVQHQNQRHSWSPASSLLLLLLQEQDLTWQAAVSAVAAAVDVATVATFGAAAAAV